jgi:hypothetical protein
VSHHFHGSSLPTAGWGALRVWVIDWPYTVEILPIILSLLKDSVVMSLRGSKGTEAISKELEKEGIAALPPVARNDEWEL